MTATIGLVLDCTDPTELARFRSGPKRSATPPSGAPGTT